MTPKQFKVRLAQLRRKTMDRQDELLIECRRALLKPGVVFARVGADAGVGGTTVAKLARGETSRPQFVTVLAVLSALGYTITITEPTEGRTQRVVATAPPFKKQVDKARKLVNA